MKKKIYVCSPCKGDIKNNRKKARLYSKYVANQGFIPLAPHLYFTEFDEFRRDNIPKERKTVLRLALEWLFQCDELWCFGETISEGMKNEIEVAKRLRMKIVHVPIKTIENILNGKI